MRKYILFILLLLLLGLLLSQLKLEKDKMQDYEGKYRIIVENGQVIEKTKDNSVIFQQGTKEIKVKVKDEIYNSLNTGDVVDLKYDLFENKLLVIQK